jgi:hypothetical protein
MTQWPRFRIVKPLFRKVFSIKPRTLTLATYGFVGSNATSYPLYYSSNRILRQIKSLPLYNTFSFSIQPSIGWDSSPSFFLKFVQGFVGENLLHNLAANAFVNDLCIVAKWKPDPPGEPEWRNENVEKRGSGIVEFVVATEGG